MVVSTATSYVAQDQEKMHSSFSCWRLLDQIIHRIGRQSFLPTTHSHWVRHAFQPHGADRVLDGVAGAVPHKRFVLLPELSSQLSVLLVFQLSEVVLCFLSLFSPPSNRWSFNWIIILLIARRVRFCTIAQVPGVWPCNMERFKVWPCFPSL